MSNLKIFRVFIWFDFPQLPMLLMKKIEFPPHRWFNAKPTIKSFSQFWLFIQILFIRNLVKISTDVVDVVLSLWLIRWCQKREMWKFEINLPLPPIPPTHIHTPTFLFFFLISSFFSCLWCIGKYGKTKNGVANWLMNQFHVYPSSLSKVIGGY